MVGGSGAIVVHRQIEAALDGYRVEELSPYWGLAPPALALALRGKPAAPIVHSLPELGPWVAHRGSELVVTFHNYYLDGEMLAAASFAQRAFYIGIMMPAVRASLRRTKWVTAVSHFTAGLVQRHHALGERLVVIRNGVDTDLFSPAEGRPGWPVKILFAGNPTRRKGAEHLTAIAEVLPEGVTMQVTSGLRGNDGKEGHGKFETVARREHEEMPEVYRAADILFFPTRREGFGLVVAEAMACGLPIVATNCSSMPELVDHGKGGFLFERGNRGQMLEYLVWLARDPMMRAEMGAYNREKILAEFPLEKMIAGYREIFNA